MLQKGRHTLFIAHRLLQFPWLLSLLWLVFPPAVWADSHLILLEQPQRQSFTGFGSSFAQVGDLDGDGVPDYVVSAYQQYWGGNMKQGRAYVFSGRTGLLLRALDLPDPQKDAGAGMTPYNGASFGNAVAAAGDVNADGTPDIVVGAFNQKGRGEAYVFDGKTGALLFTLQPPQPQLGAGFGWAVASLGDLTHDQVPELLISAIAQDGTGRAFVFDGKTRALLYTLAPPAAQSGGAFGWSVTSIGDLDKDGVPDLVIGAPYTTVGNNPVQGQAYAFSGRTGALLYVLNDPEPRASATFGWCVAVGGDFNGDRVPDVLVGAPYKDVGDNRYEGAAFVFSGVDGAPLYTLHDPALDNVYAGFGSSMAASPDLNNDGVADILVGAPFQAVDQYRIQGEVFLFDGQTGKHLSTFDNPAPHQGSSFGYMVKSLGDVNGDHVPDVAISAVGQTLLERYFAVGRVYIFLSH